MYQPFSSSSLLLSPKCDDDGALAQGVKVVLHAGAGLVPVVGDGPVGVELGAGHQVHGEPLQRPPPVLLGEVPQLVAAPVQLLPLQPPGRGQLPRPRVSPPPLLPVTGRGLARAAVVPLGHHVARVLGGHEAHHQRDQRD